MISLLHSVAVFAFAGAGWAAASADAADRALMKRQREERYRVRMNRKIAPVIAEAKWNFFASAERSRRFKGKQPPPSDSDAEDLMKSASEPRIEQGSNAGGVTARREPRPPGRAKLLLSPIIAPPLSLRVQSVFHPWL